MIDFTVVISLDEKHANELEIVWNSWVQFKPEILRQPLHVYCDDARSVKWWCHRLAFLNAHHKDWCLYLWPDDFRHRHAFPSGQNWSQREKMLSAFVFGIAETVKTPWFLKVDTDCCATGPGEWLPDWWVDGEPAMVASGWGYTKPASMIEKLDIWADGIPELAKNPPPHRRIVGNIAKSRRIISWLYVGNTAWHRKLAMWCGDRLPAPSQDTTAWYAAERSGAFIRRVAFKKLGWSHVSGITRLQSACAGLLSK